MAQALLESTAGGLGSDSRYVRRACWTRSDRQGAAGTGPTGSVRAAQRTRGGYDSPARGSGSSTGRPSPRELVVSLHTVRSHTKRIYAKLGVNDRRAAVRRATELDLLPRDGSHSPTNHHTWGCPLTTSAPSVIITPAHGPHRQQKEQISGRRDTDRCEAGRYKIRLVGHLDARWAAWFDGLTLARQNDGTTVIGGHVADQAALHGLIQKVRDTGLALVSVSCVQRHPPPVPTNSLHNEPDKGSQVTDIASTKATERSRRTRGGRSRSRAACST